MSNQDMVSIDELVVQARDLVVLHQKGSISLVQRHLRIRYNMAAVLLERLEADGVVSPMQPNGARTVLVKGGAA